VAVLDDVRQQVLRRMQELEPLMAEYRELEQFAERLGMSRDAREAGRARSPRTGARAGAAVKASRAATVKVPAATGRRSTGRGRARSRRNAAAPGSRQQDVLRLVGERPGISVSELGKELGVDPTGLYQIVRRLEARGTIRKDGRQLQPVAAPARAAGAQDAAGASA
jgi:hypothetical protein